MQQIQQILERKTYMAFFFVCFLRTMHDTALFTIIYFNSFTDNRFVTVQLPVICCDMSISDDDDEYRRTVRQWYRLQKHAEIQRTCVFLSLSGFVFRWTDRQMDHWLNGQEEDLFLSSSSFCPMGGLLMARWLLHSSSPSTHRSCDH